MVTDDGSDPPMMEVLGLKSSEATNIVDPYIGAQAVHSDVNHLRKLVERYLAKKRTGKAPASEIVRVASTSAVAS